MRGLCDVLSKLVQALNPIFIDYGDKLKLQHSFEMLLHSRQRDLVLYFEGFFSPFQSRAKGVMHLFVSIKPKLKHKRRELRDQIVALGRTTGSFCRHTTQMTQCLSSVPVCNWRLWIRYSTYFTYPFPAFFPPLKASLGYLLCSYRVNHFLCLISS